ncbi:hypothetical protein B0H19DRAFT_1083368 [Mycena capillaripes]|nr:hypothetical protein B0H19DRAFT_1083368 [Mycena capillaripes]
MSIPSKADIAPKAKPDPETNNILEEFKVVCEKLERRTGDRKPSFWSHSEFVDHVFAHKWREVERLIRELGRTKIQTQDEAHPNPAISKAIAQQSESQRRVLTARPLGQHRQLWKDAMRADEAIREVDNSGFERHAEKRTSSCDLERNCHRIGLHERDVIQDSIFRAVH